MFNDVFAKPRFRPAVNINCLMDIPTGKYEFGIHGESILNGGLSSLTGIAARPNNFKTWLAVYMLAMLRRTYRNTATVTYDTEGTMNPVQRFSATGRHDDYLSTLDYLEDPLFAFTDLSQYSGDEFFTLCRTKVMEKTKNEKEYMITTPFIAPDGKNRPALYPTGALIDSFSKFQTTQVEAIYQKNDIGDSGANTVDMMNGKAKNQMLNQIPQMCARTGTYMILTAHLGDVINMEMYPTDKRNLSLMKKDTTFKGVSSGFYSLPNNVWMITSNKPLLNDKKMPEYPLDNSTAMQGDTDLVVISMINLRGKGGISGIPIELVVTQSDGIQPGLSEFNYCKNHNRFGIVGNMQNYAMALLPDVSLSRTKVRKKLEDDVKLRRATEITSEMLQIQQFHRNTDPELLCDPEQLYNDLKAMGYDWDVLLNTRGYAVPKEEEHLHEKPFLSTMDLMRMRRNLYVPYWFSDEQRKAIKPLDPSKTSA